MANDTINIKAILDSTAVDTSLIGLKKSIRELSAIKLDILPKAQADQVKARIGELINQSKDLKQSLSTLDKGDFAQNAAKLLTPMVGAFTALGSAAELFGVESEGLNKILQKTQSITIGLMSIQQIADSDKLKSTAAYIGLQIKSFFWTGAQTKATVGATVAQRALNIAMSLNPIGAVIAAITALIGVLYLFNKSQETTTENELETQKAMDGTIIKSDELRESYNENFKTLRDLDLEYKKISGTITDFGYELEKLANANNDALYQINQDTAKALTEYEDKWSGLSGAFNKFVDNFRYLFTGTSKQKQEEKAIADKDAADRLKQQENYGKKLRNLRESQQQELNIKIAEFNKARLKQVISDLGTEYAAYSSSAKKIIDLYKNLLKTQDDYSSRRLNPEEKDISDISKYYDEYRQNITDVKTQLEEEKKVLIEIDEQIKSNEKSLKLYSGAGSGVRVILEQNIKNLEDQIKTLEQQRKQVLADPKSLGGVAPEIFNSQVDSDILDIRKQISDLGIDILNAAVANNEIQDSLLELNKKRIENLKLQKKLETDIVEISQKISPEDPVKIEEDKLKEIARIRKKYDDERKTNILNDEKEIINIKISYLDETIKNEIISEEERKKALTERIVLLNQQVEIEKDLLRIKLEQIKNDETLTQDEKDSKIKLETEKTKKVIDLSTKDVQDSTDELADSLKEKAQVIRDFIVDVLADIGNSVIEIFARSVSESFDSLFKNLDKNYEKAQNSLQNQLDNNLITQQEYDDQLEKLENEKDRKTYELQVKQFKREKALNLVKIAMDTAVAVIKSWAQGGGILGGPIAALALAAGTLQLAVVASQNPPAPEYGDGGLIDGKPHMFGGTTINAEKGEYMINKNVVAQPGMLNYLENINRGNIAGIDKNTIREIVAEISSIPVVNVESESSRVQRRVRNIETRSKY